MSCKFLLSVKKYIRARRRRVHDLCQRAISYGNPNHYSLQGLKKPSYKRLKRILA